MIGRNGSREQIDDVSNVNEHVTQKNNTPLSFLRSDWLLPEVALLTTVIIYRPGGRGVRRLFCLGGGGGHLNFRRKERGILRKS